MQNTFYNFEMPLNQKRKEDNNNAEAKLESEIRSYGAEFSCLPLRTQLVSKVEDVRWIKSSDMIFLLDWRYAPRNGDPYGSIVITVLDSDNKYYCPKEDKEVSATREFTCLAVTFLERSQYNDLARQLEKVKTQANKSEWGIFPLKLAVAKFKGSYGVAPNYFCGFELDSDLIFRVNNK